MKTPFRKKIKSRLNSANACYHSVQSPLSSCLLSRNLQVKMNKTMILPVVLYECQMNKTMILPGVLYECQSWSLA
jgi:hypothetical protein